MAGGRPTARETPLRVLILGGYGTFGGRLARLLRDEPGLALILAGRDLAKARAFSAGQANATAARVERDGDLVAQLAPLTPDVVVDASGPFQAYGPKPYRVAEACLALGCHGLDLADGRAFVTGIAGLDAQARAKGLAVISGLSTLPALSQAVVRHLSRGATPEHVTIGVAPSPFAGMGLSVVRAVAGYAGKRLGQGHALIDARRLVVAPPGRLPLRPRRFLLCEVPDDALLPGTALWAGAGTEPALLQRLLSLAAWLVRLRLLPSLAPFARLFHWALGHLRWGEPRGGMLVAVAGRDGTGAPWARSWHLLAEGDSGPNVPTLAAAAVLRRLAHGSAPAPGARPAHAELALADFVPFFTALGLATGERADQEQAAALFHRVLGEAFARLPPPLRTLHGVAGRRCFHGRAEVERGRGLAGLVARLFRLPRSGRDLPLTVTIAATPAGEVWQRDFGGQRFRSRLAAGRGREQHLLVERFGPLTFALALVLEGGRLAYVVRGWRCCGLPMPRALAPRSEAFETAAAGRFRFDVTIRLPLLGLLARYRGTLET